VTLGKDGVAVLKAGQVDLISSKRTKLNPIKLVKKRESQVGELDQLKLKTTVLHGDQDEEFHMTQPVGFIAEKLLLVG